MINTRASAGLIAKVVMHVFGTLRNVPPVAWIVWPST